MAHVVTQSCCADASCVVACPVNCIHPAPGEPGFAEAEMLFVDPKACVDCGACVTACPVGAIKPHTKLSDDQAPFQLLNAEYFAENPHPVRTPIALVPAQRRLRSRDPVRIAVVGAGPAGLYAADALLKHPEVSVDVFDRLPVPHGLVRSGVAPDHQSTKQVTDLFAAIESQPGFSYRLGVEVGHDVTFDELAAHYDGVIVAVGASSDKRLGIEGEELVGSTSATDLVGWYNGHPDHRELAPDLDTERAVVIGNGNVALDVARILTSDPDALATTDIAGHALETLRSSGVREVVVLGRRGPGQAAFTVPELIGIAGHPDIDVVIEDGGTPIEPGTARGDVLADLAARTPRPGRPRIVLRFCAQPERLLGDDPQGDGRPADERVAGVEVRRTTLVTDADGTVRAEPTDEVEVIEAGLVLRSVGYHGRPVPGLPFDEARGVVPNEQGRVRPGLYVTGWIKRGPTGFIGTNKTCAEETVERLLDDLDAGTTPRASADTGDLDALLHRRGVRPADLADWRAIDAHERASGAVEGRPRRKVVDIAELRQVAVAARQAPRKRSRRFSGAR